jgi:hypothetical protein
MTTSKHDETGTADCLTQADDLPTGRTRGVRALAVLGATAAALAVWAVAVPLAGCKLTVRLNGVTQLVGPGTVVAASLLAGLAGWALLAALERFAGQPRRTWTVTVVVIMGASLSGPLALGIHPAEIAALVAMHLAVAAVLIPALQRSARC